jgi:FMN phosphatase YigB (HAD superfamily)
LLEKRALTPLFDLVVTANCVQRHKPDPEGLHHIARQFNCCPTRLVMIGDHDADMGAARAAGSMGIRANWHGLTPGLRCGLGFPTLDSIEALVAITTTIPPNMASTFSVNSIPMPRTQNSTEVLKGH